MLKSVPMVRRGGMVRIVLDKGLLRIMTIGQSEENGARNDFVKIRNVSSGKILYARVIDENTVKIDY
jgi:flagella basal body P-ring formation protein FlgA